MLNPKIHEQAAVALTVNENTKKLLQAIYRAQRHHHQDKSDRPKIRVSSVISRMSFFYEKIRNAVDYKEEYLLRKEAIERILRRQVLIEGSLKDCQPAEISRHLLTELIRGGYLPNNQLPAALIDEIAVIIKKYLIIKDIAAPSLGQQVSRGLSDRNLAKLKQDLTKRSQLIDWLLAVGASEIEEHLGQDPVLSQAIYNLYRYLSDNIELVDNKEMSVDLSIQVYLSVNRNFAKLDDDMLSFILFKYYIADWSRLDEQQWPAIGEKIKEIRQAITSQLHHPLARPLDKITHRYAVCISILLSLLKDDPVAAYVSFKTDPKAFPRLIKKSCEERYAKAKKLLWRAALRSIIYIFLTKTVLVIALEIPANKFFNANIGLGILLINAIFPAGLLFLAVLLTRLPEEANTNQIIDLINELSFEENKRVDPIILKLPKIKTNFLSKVFNLFYKLTFLITFSAIIWLLVKLHFTWISTLIFLFFLVFVSFFIIRIKRITNELKITETKESLWQTLFDIFTLPIMSVGKYLSEKFSKVNILVFLLDFIIETPFKFFVDIAEDWTNYVKERKSQIN